MSEDLNVKAGVSIHPSHPGIIVTMGEDETEVLKMVKSPQMIMPSATEPESVKRGGLADEILGKIFIFENGLQNQLIFLS